jgi:predicted alpha-1,2-mannosidase
MREELFIFTFPKKHSMRAPLVFSLSLFLLFACSPDSKKPGDYVDPFIGTGGHGHTFPGATTPFGMVQLSPQSRLGGWDGASGYHFTDSTLFGFAHTALNGTGVGDYGDILLMPVNSDTLWTNEDYQSPFDKSTEKASPGFYEVFLEKPGVKAELSATPRVGYHRYTFPEGQDAKMLIDLTHRDKVVTSSLEIISDTELRGMRRSTNWARDMVWYFHMEFSKPIVKALVNENGEVKEAGNQAFTHESIKAILDFGNKDVSTLEVKVSLSAVDERGAYENMQAELPGWDFETVKSTARNTWNEALSKIEVSGGSKEQTTIFYTALYHAMLQPNLFQDVDGRYRGMDREIHQSNEFTNYTVFSLWDTYRAWHPLMTLIDQKRTRDYIHVMLDMYDQVGLLPIWELAGNETYTMIGNHSVSVIADAYRKGIKDFDTEKAMEAMLHSTTLDRVGMGAYIRHGYIPGDEEHESISKTLEYAYNDWCVAMMAADMGKKEIYDRYIQRAQYYKNIFDPGTGFMRPKLNGAWLDPFDPTTVDWHFTEANSWQYSFYVPHDVEGFAQLHGGMEALASKVDELFTTAMPVSGRDMKDITGLIGQYAHGNEPSHHMAYLYSYLDQPWKTQERVRQIMDELYSTAPDGLAGNEDCGQMSAWLIMSAMGFYPVNPGSPEYVIGTPWFDEVKLHLENGNTFTIKANQPSAERKYIHSASLNGQAWNKAFLLHEDIMKGGELVFKMSETPDSDFGIGSGQRAVSQIDAEAIVPVPVFSPTDKRIKAPIQVAMSTPYEVDALYYTLDGTEPGPDALRYEEPLSINETLTLKARAMKDGNWSFTTSADFYKLNINRTITLRYPYSPNYHGGGADALIDGIRGKENWRLGHWHGYQGTDFEATIDLGKTERLNYLGAGFVQDIRSWIWMPTDVSFEVSNDGVNYSEVLRMKTDLAEDDYAIQQKDYGRSISESARYIRVKAKNYGRIPDWHLGAGGQAFIFIDEILINEK